MASFLMPLFPQLDAAFPVLIGFDTGALDLYN
jgi:hypothetical protein